jgi:hypothetical protein
MRNPARTRPLARATSPPRAGFPFDRPGEYLANVSLREVRKLDEECSHGGFSMEIRRASSGV